MFKAFTGASAALAQTTKALTILDASIQTSIGPLELRSAVSNTESTC